jgi:acyl-CoA thioester hydrolase
MYMKKLYAGWSDMDINSHMRNTAYLDKAADVRQMFLRENGFPAEEFLRLRVGPVVRKDEVEYFSEVGLLEFVDVTLTIAGHAPDGSRFCFRQEIIRADGKLSARVTSSGGWLDLDKRKLVAPPQVVFRALDSLERTEDYQDLPSSVKKV